MSVKAKIAQAERLLLLGYKAQSYQLLNEIATHYQTLHDSFESENKALEGLQGRNQEMKLMNEQLLNRVMSGPMTKTKETNEPPVNILDQYE